MRLLFGFFLFLNIAYFIWQMDYFAEPAPSIIKETPLPAGVKRLALLRERGLGQDTAPVPSRGPAQHIGAESKSVASEPDQVVESVAPEREDALDAHEASIPVASVPLVEPEPSPEPKTREPVQMACFTLGPFEKDESINKASEAISALDVKNSRRQSEQRTPKNYWVYLSQDSYSSARQTVKTLQSKGIRDLFIMGKGANKDAVSLGLFSNKTIARQRIMEVRRLGFDPIMETQYRVTAQQWLDIEVDSKRTSTVATITAIVEDFKGTTLTQHKCE
jgi:hypothetical protein